MRILGRLPEGARLHRLVTSAPAGAVSVGPRTRDAPRAAQPRTPDARPAHRAPGRARRRARRVHVRVAPGHAAPARARRLRRRRARPQYWMWHWRDPALFGDALTEQLRESARYPDGYQALFWLASHVARPDRVRRVARRGADGAVGMAGLRDRARARAVAPGGLDRRRAVPRPRRHPPVPRRLPARVRASGRAALRAAGDARP